MYEEETSQRYKWHPDCIPAVKWVVEYAKANPRFPYLRFSKIKISEVKARKNTKEEYLEARGGAYENEWYDCSFIRKLKLEGSNRYFSIGWYNRKKQIGSSEPVIHGNELGYFFLQFSEKGVKMTPYSIKNRHNYLAEHLYI